MTLGSIGTLPTNPVAIAIKYTMERMAEDKRDAAEWAVVPPEDRFYITARGMGAGAPVFDGDVVMCVAERIYANPADPGTRPKLEYYDANIAKRIEADVRSLNLQLQQPSLDESAKAQIQKKLDYVPTIKEVAKQQMASLLTEAKLLLTQRGVDGEAEVRQTNETIDAVLRNMQSIEAPGMSGQAAKFLNLYSRVKANCEIAVGRGRNPFPMIEHMHDTRGTGAAEKERWEEATELVRPQVRAMAYQLNELLTPYAQPLSSDEARPEGQDKPHTTFWNKMVNRFWHKA